MNKIVPLILLCLILFSCEKALDIELPSRKSRLVVNSYLITDQFWDNKNQFLLLSNSISGMGTLDDFIYTDSLPLIDFGTVIINEIDKDNFIVNQFPLEFNTNCYCYTNQSFKPRENKTYELQVEAEGFPRINSRETMPSKPVYIIEDFQLIGEIDNVEEDVLCEFKINLKDTPFQKNYYRLKVSMINTFSDKSVSCTYEVNDPSFLIPINRYNSSNTFFKGRNGYFTDRLFDGEEKSLYIKVDKPEGVYDHFIIEITSYSENLYNFNLTRQEQNGESNNFIFNSEAIFIDSNIDGGYGIFGGRATSSNAYIPTYYPLGGWVEY